MTPSPARGAADRRVGSLCCSARDGVAAAATLDGRLRRRRGSGGQAVGGWGGIGRPRGRGRRGRGSRGRGSALGAPPTPRGVGPERRQGGAATVDPVVAAAAPDGVGPHPPVANAARETGARVRLNAPYEQEGTDRGRVYGERGWGRCGVPALGDAGAGGVTLARRRPSGKNWIGPRPAARRGVPGIVDCRLGRPETRVPPRKRGPRPIGRRPPTA